MTITPDTKNWTWVLERPCPDCAYDSSAVVLSHIGATIRDITSQWEAVLAQPHATVRPRPDVWSPAEYGCHIRDVYRLFDARIDSMLAQDAPSFASWDQDAAAIADKYHDQDPLIISGELAVAGNQLADRFDNVSGSQWTRTGLRSDGATFTVESFGRYLLHDPIHHLWDVSRTF